MHSHRQVTLPQLQSKNYFVCFSKGARITNGCIIQASSYAGACAIARAQCKPFHNIHSIQRA